MKKYIVIVTTLMLIVLFPVAADSESHQDLDTLVPHLLSEYGVTDIADLDPSQVSSEDLAMLGDSVMDELIGNEWRHEMMDAMYGGEGSAQLDAYHSDLARSFILSGGDLNSTYGGGYGYGMRGMSRGGFFGGNRGGYGYSRPFAGEGMPGTFEYYHNNLYPYMWIIHIILAVIIIAGIIVTIVLVRKGKKKGNSSEYHMLILKQRFAAGQMSAEEFDRRRKILK